LEDLLDISSKYFDKVTKALQTTKKATKIIDVISESLNKLYERKSCYENNRIFGVPTGIEELDNFSNGWQNNDLIILAARPSMGKTAVALHFAKSAAKAGKNVRFYSLEMGASQLTDRLIISECHDLDSDDYNKGRLNETLLNEIEYNAQCIANLPLTIIDSISELKYIEADAILANEKQKIDLIIIDYLQLVENNSNKTKNEEVAIITRAIKKLAKEKLGIPIILLSQLNRGVENRMDKMPNLSDLRDSGAIEQDGDQVIFLLRPDKYEPQLVETQGHSIIFNFAKYRNGSLREFQLSTIKMVNRFWSFGFKEDIF